ncbi:MAG: tetratricopeptide repeat protein [Candidatus Omnitrophica bacterium]|nr:tetratricopeptide repeat protein [Candidatus Omnitrophota bacterium]
MSSPKKTWVLEILKQRDALKMALFEKEELSSTLKHYQQIKVSLKQIGHLSCELFSLLENTDIRYTAELDPRLALKKVGMLLWEQLLTKAIKERLSELSGGSLLLSIDEELIHIPWELLYDGKDFFSLKFNLGRSVHTKKEPSRLRYRSLDVPLKMLILANPTGDLSSSYLEGIKIRDRFSFNPQLIRIDFKSTQIDTLYIKKHLGDYDIIHFAGHCEYDLKNPQESGWVFSDGRLTALEIINLGSTLSLPLLIFSNACHSAKIDSNQSVYLEKNFNLASTFLFCGVRHYIGTIKKIEDKTSLYFAQEFYNHLIMGRTVGESIRLARLALIKERGLGMFDWAGYLLYGDPNFSLFKPSPKIIVLTKKRSLPFKRFKRPLAILSSLFFFGLIIIYLSLWLPTLNPHTYFLYLKSKQAYLSGRNQQVLYLGESLIKKDPFFLNVYPLLAQTYNRLGNRQMALKYYFDYSFYSQKKNDTKHLILSYIGIGWLYYLKGDYPKAFDFYQKALDLSRAHKDRVNEAVTLRRLALCYMDKNNPEEALSLLTKSSEINRERRYIQQHRYNLACDYFDLALLFTNKDDFDTAEEFYQKSQAIFESLRLKDESSDYYFNLGEIYLFKKQYPKALELYLKGLSIDQRQGNLPNLASDYNMLGQLYLEMDNLKEAENFFFKALAICEGIDGPLELAETYYNLGLLYKKKNNKDKAKEYLSSALRIYEEINPYEAENIKKELKK